MGLDWGRNPLHQPLDLIVVDRKRSIIDKHMQGFPMVAYVIAPLAIKSTRLVYAYADANRGWARCSPTVKGRGLPDGLRRSAFNIYRYLGNATSAMSRLDGIGRKP